MQPILLEHDETMALIELAQKGDKRAQEKLITHNVALIKSIVKKFLGRGTEYEDLFQLGSMGLIKAINNFDPAYNVRFSTYAVPLIAGEIKRFLRDDGMIKVSRSLKEINIKAQRANELLKIKLARDPSIKEVANEIGVEPEDIIMAQDSMAAHISLEEPIFESGEGTVMDTIQSHEDESNMVIDALLIKDLLGQLEPKERQIIFLRYFKDKTQSEIGKMLSLSQVQVSRLESKIIKKLKVASQ